MSQQVTANGSEPNVNNRTVFANDNLKIMRNMNSECVDLIYLDPPFNKKKQFIAPMDSAARGAEFLDKFTLDDIQEIWLSELGSEDRNMFNFIQSIRTTNGKKSSKQYNYAYIVYMAIRLIECKRILKSTGSIYLHCDPTMSHYLKLLMDFIFGEKNFRNEIVWCYSGGGIPQNDFPRKHDIIFRYTRSSDYTFNVERKPYKENTQQVGKHSTLSGGEKIDLERGTPVTDWWTDIKTATGWSKERTDYPTQKPLTLLKRIVQASSNKGDWVLDPFCGCATTCVAAEALGRKWIGIDKSQMAWRLTRERMEKELAGVILTENQFTFVSNPPAKGKTMAEDKKFVYVISNKAFKGIYKIGIATNVKNRLNSYQTSDPHRNYKLEFSAKTSNYLQIENNTHAHFNGDYEWVQGDLQEIIAFIKKQVKLR